MQPLRYAVDQPLRGHRRRLLERIQPSAEILDVGCWAGGTGRFLVDRGATVDGVEPEGAMAHLASSHYREVTCARIEDALPTLLGRGRRYDALLFLDVLEHLVDPWSILSQCRSLLRDDGRAYVSLPNVAHWSLRKELLAGRWEYRDSGLLDRTHLRFFTLRSGRALVEESGWRISWEGADVDQPPIIRLPDRWLRVFRRWPSLFAVQCLFELAPVTPGELDVTPPIGKGQA